MWIVIFEHREEDVEDRYPSERAADITLPASHFGVEVQSFESFDTFFDPLGEGVTRAHDGVVTKIEQDQPFNQGGGDAKTSPGQPNQPLPDGVKRFPDVPARAE